MKRLADRFGEAAAACSSLNDLRSLLSDAASELGFRYFALLHHSSLTRPGARIRIDNYPSEWVEELIRDGQARDDPVHLACRRASMAFAWSNLDDLVVLGPKQRAILERSRYHGIGQGITVPVNVPGEPGGSCSFAVACGCDLPERRLDCGAAVGMIGFSAARRIANLPCSASPPHLSRREVECLRLLAAGKTDWEIGVILGISAETARQYVKRARATYDVVSRTQLALLALRDQWVDFEDAQQRTSTAIPPNG